jgi:peptidoglycan/xylan/chitin deacetylase (PgdA/CDA1 family)
MSRPVLLSTGLAAMLMIGAAAPTMADTPLWHWGVRGHHALIDTAADPGARCQYDAVTRALSVIRVRPPVVKAVDRTAGTDRQLVGARAWLERRTSPAGPWVRVAGGPLETATATDSTSPFHTTVSLVPLGPGDYRVFWTMSWYGVDGALTGRAEHRVDQYVLRVGSVSTAHVTGSCPADQGAAPSTLVTHGSRSTPRVALTFDMGGRVTPAVAIMDWLIGAAIPATIFATGATGSLTPEGGQVLGLVTAHPELFEVGNHSWDHPRFVGLTAEEIADQLERTDTALSDITGVTTRPWFRPPYGSTDATVQAAVGAAGWALTVRWDVVTTDYLPKSQGGPTTQELVDQVLSRAKNGSIVIMHLGGYRTLDALPAIVAGLRDRGLEPATLGTLLGI